MSNETKFISIITLVEYGSLVCVVQAEDSERIVVNDAFQLMVEDSTGKLSPFRTMVDEGENLVLIPYMGFLTNVPQHTIMRANVISQSIASEMIAEEYIGMVTEMAKEKEGLIVTQPQGIIIP